MCSPTQLYGVLQGALGHCSADRFTFIFSVFVYSRQQEKKNNKKTKQTESLAPSSRHS